MIPLVLAGGVCAYVLVFTLTKPNTFRVKPPHVEPAASYQEVPPSIGLCFDSLLAWQSGDTNQFQRLIHESEYDSHLRNAVRNSIEKGRGDEVLRWANLYLNNWIIVEASHSRNYEWPDNKTDRTAWELLSKIFANRQQYPFSTGDVEVDVRIKRILDNTLGIESR